MGGSGGGGPKGWGPEPEISRFFFSLPREISFFLLSLGGLLVEFWWCLKRRGRQMFTFGVLWLLCEATAAPKPPGFHTTAREPKRAHLSAPAFKNTTTIPREDLLPRERRKNEISGLREKNAKFWSWQTLAKPTLAKPSSTCVVVFVVCGVFVCLCVCVCALTRFHGVGSRVGVGFKVLVWSCSVPPEPPFSWTAPSLSRRKIRCFLPSLGVLFVEFWWCF